MLATAGPWPATLEEAVTVDLRIRWRGEDEVNAQVLLKEASVAARKRGIRVANDLFAVGDGRSSLIPVLGRMPSVANARKGTRRTRLVLCVTPAGMRRNEPAVP